MNEHAPSAPLSHLGPQWFAPVMGWGGLGLAWHRAADGFGDAADTVATACALLAAAVFLSVLLASLLRWARHPRALAEDLRHPVRHAFAAALPVSLIILATNAVALLGPQSWMVLPWAAGVLLQSVVLVWVVARWFSGRKQWPGVTPVLYIPVVGNVLVPLAGVPLDYPMVSWFFFGIGMFFWPVLTAMLLVRQILHPMPDRLLPSWFIMIAPPAVGALSAVSLGASPELAMAGLGVAVLSAAAAASRVPGIARQPFAMPFWAMSFPVTALAALLLRLAHPVPALAIPGIAVLAIASVLILGLTLATLKGLRAGTLLAPEPAVPIAPSN
jgi:tellurite resistance protein